jgi:hypothetical protein
MVSELNGQENYFTRICVAGLLNTRKLELTQMLLQDINIFHVHPAKMADSSHENNMRFVSAAISNMTSNERKIKTKEIMKKLDNKLPIGPSSLIGNNRANSIQNLASEKSTSTKKITIPDPIVHSQTPTKSNQSLSDFQDNNFTKSNVLTPDNLDDIETALNDMASFILYASRKPLKVYQPIRQQFSWADERVSHKVTHISCYLFHNFFLNSPSPKANYFHICKLNIEKFEEFLQL